MRALRLGEAPSHARRHTSGCSRPQGSLNRRAEQRKVYDASAAEGRAAKQKAIREREIKRLEEEQKELARRDATLPTPPPASPSTATPPDATALLARRMRRDEMTPKATPYLKPSHLKAKPARVLKTAEHDAPAIAA